MCDLGRSLRRILIFLFLLAVTPSVHALTINSDQLYKVWEGAEYAYLPSDAGIYQAIHHDNWQLAKDQTPGIGFSNDAVWMRVPLKSIQAQAADVQFIWSHSQLHFMGAYLITQESSTLQLDQRFESSNFVPLSQLDIISNRFEWQFHLQPQVEYQLYLVGKSDFSVSFWVNAGDNVVVQNFSRIQTNITAVFVGVMLALIMYNLAILWTTRDPSYLFYILYVFFITCYILVLEGYAGLLGIVDSRLGMQRLTFSLIPLFLTSSLAFAWWFLNLKNQYSWIKSLFQFLCLLQGLILILGLIPMHDTYVDVTAVVVLLTVSSMVGFGVVSWKSKGIAAALFSVGWFFMLLGVMSHEVAIVFGVESEALGRESLKISAALEALFLSWALAHRIQLLTRENELLQTSKRQILKEANDNLAARLNMQQELVKQKDELLSVISHELKTPLQSLQSSIELNSSGSKDSPCSALTQGAERLRHSIDNLVLMAELTTDQVELVARQTLWSSITAQIDIKVRSHDTDGNRFRFNHNVAENAALMIDERLLLRLLENLLDNAFKFCEQGEIYLSCQWNHETGNLTWCLRDQGEGIDHDKLQLIRQVFSQSDASRTRRHEGLGLGLPLCTQISTLFNGHLELESIQGKGTTVTFSHPVNLDLLSETNQRLPTARALVVEDNPVNAQMMLRFLQNLGLDVDHAIHGQEAVEKAAQQSYQLIIMDIQMPVMDGIEASRIIREQGYTGVIMAVSANDTSHDRRQATAAGMDDFLGKPVRLAYLKSKLSEYQVLPEANPMTP